MLAERLRNQCLTGPGRSGPVEVVAWLGAVQAQDFPGALWALAQRIEGAVTEADLLQAFDAGLMVRTHILRPTWHLVAQDDIRWMLALSAPRVQAACGNGYKRLGIDARTRLRAERVLQRALAGGRHLTRHELAAALQRAGLATDEQRLVYLLIHAELEGLICSGPRRGKVLTYALLDERVPASPSVERDEALARLLTRYFTSHGPATLKDAAWWSGLTLRDVREGLALAGDTLEHRVLDGRDYYSGAGSGIGDRESRIGDRGSRIDERSGKASRARGTKGTAVHLLPNFDEYTVAYRDRIEMVPAGTEPTSLAQSALLMQPMMVDGRSAGTWRRTLKAAAPSTAHRLPSTIRSPRSSVPRPQSTVSSPRSIADGPAPQTLGHVQVEVSLHDAASRLDQRALERAAASYGAFLGRTVMLQVG